jgi:hypothetical protein
MNQRVILVGLASVMLLAAVAAWWFTTFERVEDDIPAPLHGEARYNPFYALKKTLQARGMEVTARANLNLPTMQLAPDDTVVLGADVRTLTHEQVGDLLAWVEAGGQLVFALPQGDEGRGGELLDALGLSVTSGLHCLSWPGADSGKKPLSCFRFRFKFDAQQADSFDLLVGDAEAGYVMGRSARGDGGWLVAGDLDFLHNDRLDDDGIAAFAWQVLAPVLRAGKVHIVYALDVPPLYVLLVERGWPTWLPALLALLAWLWARSQRFGPLLPAIEVNRRALREHVAASGEFLFRRGRASALYAPLRRAFDERLRRDDPALGALDGEALVTAVAARSGRPVAEVRVALDPRELRRPEHFLATIKILNELETRP